MESLISVLVALLPPLIIVGFFFIIMRKGQREVNSRRSSDTSGALETSSPSSTNVFSNKSRAWRVRLFAIFVCLGVAFILYPSLIDDAIELTKHFPVALVVISGLVVALLVWSRRRESDQDHSGSGDQK